ncbi:MAG: HTTM domain-containing protein [Deltaproteobacteria bacterium]|nr:HTTM domain-containing protein [Deltaproteobacteria bacterium]
MIAELIEGAVTAVHAYFAQPIPVLGFGLSRIALGLVFVVDGLMMLRDHDTWYGADALRPTGPAEGAPSRWDPMGWVERHGGSSRSIVMMMVASAVAFGLGLATTLSGALLLLTLVMIPLRNRFIVYGGDAFARTVLLLLLLSPCGSSVGIDRWLSDGTAGLDAQAPAWGGRLVQLEVAALYLTNFIAKVPSAAWRKGAVMIDLLRNRNFARRDVPSVLTRPTVGRLMTWGALTAELVLGPALLVAPTAAVACAAAIAFHIAIARLIDVHLFSAVMVASLLSLLPADLLRTVGSMEPVSAVVPMSLAHALALGLVLVYGVYAVSSDWPGQRQGSTRLRWLRAPLRWIGWNRGWRLFTTSAPTGIEVEITVIDARAQAVQWSWDGPRDLLPRSPRAIPVWPGHRFQRFTFSLVREVQARQRLVARFRAALRDADIVVRGWSIDVLYVEVHGRVIEGGLNVGAQVASTADGRPDVEAAARLAEAVRCPPTRDRLGALARLVSRSNDNPQPCRPSISEAS